MAFFVFRFTFYVFSVFRFFLFSVYVFSFILCVVGVVCVWEKSPIGKGNSLQFDLWSETRRKNGRFLSRRFFSLVLFSLNPLRSRTVVRVFSLPPVQFVALFVVAAFVFFLFRKNAFPDETEERRRNHKPQNVNMIT